MRAGFGINLKRGIRAFIPLFVACLALFLFLPVISPAWSEGEPVRGAAAAEPAGDPLGRLPSSPQEAHERLQESGVDWPSGQEGEGAEFEAADVQPGLRISIPYDTVEGYTSHANAAVKVDLIQGPSTYTINTTTNNARWFFADFSTIGRDIQSGNTVQVTDLAGGVTVTVDCTLTGTVNTSSERVSGSAPSGNSVDAYIKIPNTYYGDIPPGVAHQQVTASGGAYTATFTGTNIRNGDVAYLYSTNAAGNVVMNVARTGPALVVYPQYDEVMGFYQPGVSLNVQAGSVVQTVGTARDGFFDAWFIAHDIVPGETVSCNLGTNHTITVADIYAMADPWSNTVTGTAPPNRPLRITMDTYGDPVVVELTSNGSGAFTFNFDGVYNISGIEVYNIAWYNDAGDCVVYEFQTYSWFLPEGYTGQGFDEWVLIMNPMDSVAYVRVIFQTLTGPVEGPWLATQPGTRTTIHVNEWVAFQEQVSTMVTAIDGAQIMAERAMYMYGTIDGKWGAHDSIGIVTPSPIWYLPEGATYFGFDEWVLIQNPNDTAVQAKVQFLERGGVARELNVDIQARSRYTVHANEFVPNMEISTRVECLTEQGGQALPIFAERAMYMATADGKRGAHDSIGLSTPAPQWYLPEGTTRPGFDEWVLVMNPNGMSTNVKATFHTPQGVGGEYEFTMLPNSRGTIHVNDFIVDNDVSTVVESLEGAGILAERAMYIDTIDGKRGAHDSIGAFQTDTYWFLPEGTTRPGFDEWVLIQNPNDVPAEVVVTMLGPNGPAAQTTFTMAPLSRFSIHVNDFVNDLDVSTVVESVGASPVGILAERAMYMWTIDHKQGAHDSIGVPNSYL